ncbi:uncharacterized protein ERp60 isoform X1 [Tribolium castaneum]|uniref:uncharacterized protein ERp60 isoform X1 n=1 Tax=Tribolium castaneum TaxID=7070 RepID=UPI0030FF1D5E
MENASFSSDDEIACGPLTLREIKKELARSPRKIKCRETDSGIYYTFASSILVNQVQQNDEKSVHSENSEYYTPEQSTNKVEAFLEQVSKVIDSENTDECTNCTYTTTVDTVKRDTLGEILRHNREQPDLNDFCESLVENSALLSPDPDDIFSVDSDDSIQEIQNEESCAENRENSISSDSLIEEISDKWSYAKSDSNDVIVISDESVNDSVSDVFVEEPIFVKTEQKQTEAVIREALTSCNLEEKEQSLQESFNSDQVNSFHESEESEEKPTSSESGQNDSLEFNDTLEEMEMALKHGLGYVFPGDLTSQNSTPFTTPSHETNPKSNLPSSKKKLFQPTKFSHIQSPVADYIKKNNDPFKMPLNPVKSRTPQNSRIPRMQPKCFTNTMSPVAVYIKNSPCSFTKQNVVAKPTALLTTAGESVLHNKDRNVDLPVAVYKPPRKVITYVQKDVVLPSSLQKYVPESTVAEHEKRTKTETDTQTKILDEDLTTVDSSLLEDTSFLQVKQALLK